MNVIEAIQAECDRVRKIIKIYDDLPQGAGLFGASWMSELIHRSEKAIASGDVVECVVCLKQLREVEA